MSRQTKLAGLKLLGLVIVVLVFYVVVFGGQGSNSPQIPPVVAGSTVLWQGSGDGTHDVASPQFSATGAMQVTYTYDCGNYSANFAVQIEPDTSEAILAVNDLVIGAGGPKSTTSSLAGTSSPYDIRVQTSCSSWTVTVRGTP